MELCTLCRPAGKLAPLTPFDKLITKIWRLPFASLPTGCIEEVYEEVSEKKCFERTKRSVEVILHHIIYCSFSATTKLWSRRWRRTGRCWPTLSSSSRGSSSRASAARTPSSTRRWWSSTPRPPTSCPASKREGSRSQKKTFPSFFSYILPPPGP